MKNGIDVYFVSLSEEDPSDMGFEKVINLIKEANQTSFSDLMRMKLNGKKTKIYGNLMTMNGKSILQTASY
jgi:hypothetical protein